MERRAELQCPVVGVARDEWSAATLRDHARQAIEDSGEKISEPVFRRLAERLSMVSGDYQDPKIYDRIARAVEGLHLPVFYLEIRRPCLRAWWRAWPERASPSRPGSR